MDEKAAYELTIAEKLELLTVPDKVDAIWARIEAMLDIDMPTDDDPGDPPATSPSGGLWNIKSIALIFIAALIATIYFTSKKPITSTDTISTPFDSTKTVIDQPNNINNKPPPVNSVQPSQRSKPGSGASIEPSVPLPVNMDSLLFNRSDDPPAVRTDSVMNNMPGIPVVIPPADTVKKKSRGVKGITDDDYKIVPDKDSVP